MCLCATGGDCCGSRLGPTEPPGCVGSSTRPAISECNRAFAKADAVGIFVDPISTVEAEMSGEHAYDMLVPDLAAEAEQATTPVVKVYVFPFTGDLSTRLQYWALAMVIIICTSCAFFWWALQVRYFSRRTRACGA